MEIRTCGPSGMGWDQCTFEGSERAQLIVWSRLPLRRKLEALEEMCDHARATIASRQRAGLPYFDPETGELVKPEKSLSG
ncbi:MAG: hypothetical protein ACR2ID_05155 [Chthoniobacterales bacterium]